MTLAVPNDIENETPADAVEVDQNFKVTQDYVNANAIIRNGTVAMQAPLQLFGDPINDDDAVRKGYVDALLPVGIVLPYAGITVPAGQWAFCNGASLQTATFPDLFQVCQYRYGGSGGSFNIPDLRARTLIGMDDRPEGTLFNTTGLSGGSRDAIVVKHKHGLNAHTHPINHNHVSAQTTEAGGHAHNFPLNDPATSGAGSGNEPGLGKGGTDAGSGTTAGAGTHRHHVDFAMTTGLKSGGPDKTDTADTGDAATDKNLPPYLVLSWVIRVG